VVIAIIAILAAMLLPALQNAKATAKSSVCVGNIKQLSYGTQMYIEDYGGYIPSPYSSAELNWISWWSLVGEEEFNPGLPGNASGYIKWKNHNLDGYSDSFKCPASDQITPKWNTYVGERFNAHYGMNSNLRGASTSPVLNNLRKIQLFPRPDDTLFIGDGQIYDTASGYYFTPGISGGNGSGTSISDYPSMPYIWNYPQFKCHNMSVNISFLDQHVEPFKRVPFKRWVGPYGQSNDQWRLYWTLPGIGRAY
jgi:type II secretory pathway pseudopilin PulG